jgi:hypothetical protein
MTGMSDKPHHLIIAEAIVELIANPGDEPHPSEQTAWNLLGELANGFGEYLAGYIKHPDISDEESLGLRRAGVLFHQMIIDAQKGR